MPPQPEPGLATWKYLPGVDRRPLIEIPVLSQPNTFPAWCSETTAVIWSSTITTSSTKPLHWDANIPTVAEPQPTLILFSLASLMMGGFPAWTIIFEPLSIVNSTASLLQRFIITSHVILPSIKYKRCRLIIRIGSSRTNRSNKNIFIWNYLSIPIFI